ncbi:hypothetical protein V7S43_011125 [Phytophthora oleae]|uniref:Secreted protein n=1 Tax=Phytophthora oleae TaxID=2107226 RepID=A0ABD3FCQ0_9STRA
MVTWRLPLGVWLELAGGAGRAVVGGGMCVLFSAIARAADVYWMRCALGAAIAPPGPRVTGQVNERSSQELVHFVERASDALRSLVGVLIHV